MKRPELCPGLEGFVSVSAASARINKAPTVDLVGNGSFRCANAIGINPAAALRPQSSQPTPEPCEDSRDRLGRTGLRHGGGRKGGQQREGENADEAAEADSIHGKGPLSRARSGPATAAGRARLQRNGAPSRVKKFGCGTSALFTNV